MPRPDLSGGLDPSCEFGVREHPQLDLLRDSVSLWLFDDRGRFGLPRVTLEAAGPGWDPKLLQVNVAFPDGRVLDGSGRGAAKPAEDERGRLSIFAGGGLEFRCIEPFASWVVSFDGPVVDTHAWAQIARTVDRAVTTRVQFEVELTLAAPPWIQGEMLVSRQGEARLQGSDAIFIGGRRSTAGGVRYEQLVRAAGSLRVGDQSWTFTGSGLRVRRCGQRGLQGFTGHVWQSALFPSGRGFGSMWLLPNDYKEGFLFDRGRMIPARSVETSWMTGMRVSGEDVSFVMESELGRTRIEAETVYSCFFPKGEAMPTEGRLPLHWQQAGVRYRWDGEESYGMMERSFQPEEVDA